MLSPLYLWVYHTLQQNLFNKGVMARYIRVPVNFYKEWVNGDYGWQKWTTGMLQGWQNINKYVREGPWLWQNQWSSKQVQLYIGRSHTFEFLNVG